MKSVKSWGPKTVRLNPYFLAKVQTQAVPAKVKQAMERQAAEMRRKIENRFSTVPANVEAAQTTTQKFLRSQFKIQMSEFTRAGLARKEHQALRKINEACQGKPSSFVVCKVKPTGSPLVSRLNALGKARHKWRSRIFK